MRETKRRVASQRNPVMAQSLSDLSGMPVRELPRPVSVGDLVFSRLCHEQQLPCWASGDGSPEQCMTGRHVLPLLREADWEYRLRCVWRAA